MTPVRNNARWLELQVSIIAIAMGIVAVSSVMAAERQMLKRLHAGLKPAVLRANTAIPTPVLVDARD